METNTRFIIKPYFFYNPYDVAQKQQILHYTDVLTYIGIKSFDNSSNDCFPSLETIADKIGTSKNFVTPSIKRLETSGYLSVYRSKKIKVPNRYFFPDPEKFQKIRYTIFECTDLTHNQKAMLLLLKEACISWVDIRDTRSELAAKFNMGYNMFATQLNQLIAKGYVQQRHKSWFKLLKIDWYVPDIEKKKADKYQFILT